MKRIKIFTICLIISSSLFGDKLSELICSMNEKPSITEFRKALAWKDRDSVVVGKYIYLLSDKEIKNILNDWENISKGVQISIIASLAENKNIVIEPYAIKMLESKGDDVAILTAIGALVDLNVVEKNLNKLWALGNESKRVNLKIKEVLSQAKSDTIDSFLKEKLNSKESDELLLTISIINLRGNKNCKKEIFGFINSENTAIAKEAINSIKYYGEKDDFEFVLKVFMEANHELMTTVIPVLVLYSDKFGFDKKFSDILKDKRESLDEKKRRAVDRVLISLREMPPLGFISNCISKNGECFNSEQIKFAKENGIKSIALLRVSDDKVIKEVKDAGIDIVAIYYTCSINNKGDFTFKDNNAIDICKDAGAVLWLSIRKEKRASPMIKSVRDKLIDGLRNIARSAEEKGVKVSLYPHVNFYAEDLKDVLELQKEINMPNVYITFNYWHESAKNITNRDKFASLVLSNLHKIDLVTINGYSTGRKKSGSVPDTLGGGASEPAEFLRLILNGGYKGPILMQGYNIYKDVPRKVFVSESMTTWKNLFR